MRSAAMPVLLLVLAAAGMLFAYATIRPALIIMILSGMALSGFMYCVNPDTRRQLGMAPFMLGLGLPCAAWLAPNIWFLLAVMLVSIPLLARKPGEVAGMYLFALLLLPGLDQSLAAGSIKLFEFGVHDALAVGAGLRLILRPGKAKIPPTLDFPAMALILLIVAATARETSMTNFIRVLINGALDFALPYYIISRSIKNYQDVKILISYIVASSVIISVVLTYEVNSSWPIYNILYEYYKIDMQLMVKFRGGMLRAGGPFLESTSIAMVLTFCFLAAWLSRPMFRSSFHYVATLGVLMIGLAAPQSRGAWIGLLVGMLAADIYRRQMGIALRRMAIVGVAGFIVVALAPMSPDMSETLGLSGGSTKTVDYRERLLERGMEEFWTSPIFGYSTPQISVRLADLRQGEGIIDFVNTYIYFALVSGIIGLLIFVGAFLFYLSKLWRLRRRMRAGDEGADVRAFAFAGLVMPMEMLFFTSFGGRPEVFVFAMFALASAILAIKTGAPAPVRRTSQRDVQIIGNNMALTP